MLEKLRLCFYPWWSWLEALPQRRSSLSAGNSLISGLEPFNAEGAWPAKAKLQVPEQGKHTGSPGTNSCGPERNVAAPHAQKQTSAQSEQANQNNVHAFGGGIEQSQLPKGNVVDAGPYFMSLADLPAGK